MYDMYQWDQPGHGDTAAAGRPEDGGRPAGRAGETARALQESLDRRDNGGDGAVPRPA